MRPHILLFYLGVFFTPWTAFAQEEGSAELYLEAYSDSFQENFFEALKQKGIENYDKAINLLLECKRIAPDDPVVDHELAKAYMASKDYVLAQGYAISVVKARPKNRWYLNTLVDILQKQGNTLEGVKSELPFNDNELQQNLALIYYRQGNYEKAMNVLSATKTTAFSDALMSKLKDSMALAKQTPTKNGQSKEDVVRNPLEDYRSKIDLHLTNANFVEALSLSKEALERFPSQPYFYYAYGTALNETGESKAALQPLLEALDYLLDDPELANKIYKALGKAYNTLGNTSKANMYLRKIKPGS
ncbi:tetratricopeptide repeat protein [Spongiimicrobium sp. 2-473A-2-J]|uniref:tetratricopeptide repeat protein n=1 Tax=Eudoraea algarum TaxID=3417568 RepID=UPI003D36EE4A